MKITVDTKEDSPEEIAKLVRFLKELGAGGEKVTSGIFSDSAPLENSPPLASLFGNDATIDSVENREDSEKIIIEDEEEKLDPGIKIVPYL